MFAEQSRIGMNTVYPPRAGAAVPLSLKPRLHWLATFLLAVTLSYALVGLSPFSTPLEVTSDDMVRGNVYNQVLWVVFASSGDSG